MQNIVSIQATMYDQKDPTYIPHPDNPEPGRAPYGSVTPEPKSQMPGLAILRSHYGWEVYHVPADGTPGKSIPARLPGVHGGQIVDGSLSVFKLLRDATTFMKAVAAARVLPIDHAATRTDVEALAAWLKDDRP